MPQLTRRALLRTSAVAAVAGGLTATAGPAPASAQTPSAGEDWVRVVLITIDGLRPDEVWQMPTLAQLATDGWYFPHSRAQMIAETTPNHVSMITGMRADRHGMPGNAVAYLPDDVGLEPRYLQCDSIYSLIARQAPDLVAAAATSKEYVVAMTRHRRVDPQTTDADAVNDPFIVPVSGAAVDAEVGADAVAFLAELGPDLLWMSLGDVDRVGHVDPTGSLGDPTGLPPALRTVTLQTADAQVRQLVDALQADGGWDRTVLLVTADHSMDWSLPDAIVTLSPAFDEIPGLAGQYGAAQNGGACTYWLLAPEAAGAADLLAAMREVALATEGVVEGWYTHPNPADGGEQHWVGATRPDWGLTGDRVGDLVVVVADGYRITEPTPLSNPIPGNHGHVVTLPIPQIVAGGWDGLRANDAAPATPLDPVEDGPADDVRDPSQGENIDIAPTIAWLLGLHPPPGGFDGRVWTEAFDRRPATRLPVADVPNVPHLDRVGGEDRIATAVALSVGTFPDPVTVDGLVVAAAGDFPDALAATPLAAALGGPLLLTGTDALDDRTAAEIARLAPSTVAVVGGPAAVAEAVLAAIADVGVEDVVRVAGASRYATAAAIATAVGQVTTGQGLDAGAPPQPAGEEGAGLPEGFTPDVVLASGTAFPDALVAGPLAAGSGRVILLTGADEVPPATRAAVEALAPARVLIAGGVAAVSEAVEAEVGEGRVTERLGGADRFATAAALVERTVREGGHTDRAFLVSGDDFPDALAAGASVAALGGMLLPLAAGRDLSASGAVADLLERRADGLVAVTVVGGEAAVSAALADAVAERLLAVRAR
ncbi:cell wall-binding repeat-containing protein [Euzebya sp.]|uniref:cell wall-binding repeat-containing protein n=1 Tax=Euzebya sp. TaxID=1971409 RepID=UPI003517B7D9